MPDVKEHLQNADEWQKGIKKYGLVTVMIATLPFILPYIDKYLSNKTRGQTEAFVYKIKAEIVSDIEKIIDEQTAVAIKAHAKTRLDDEQALYLMKTAVGYQSIHKIEWLQRYLEGLNVNTFKDIEYTIKSAIRGELTRQSNVYIDALNQFTHPKLGNLGNFVATHFDMDEFLDGVYNIVFTTDCSDCETMYNTVMYHMLNVQNELWSEAEKEMSK